MKMSKFKLFLLISLAASILLLVGFYPVDPAALAVKEDHQDTTLPTRAGFQAEGRLVPVRWVNLSFPTSGSISAILVAEGDQVAEGAVLAAQGDSRKHAARVAAAELALLSAEQAYADLHENARLELALAEQRLALARKVQENAAWKARSVSAPASSLTFAQAHANMLLAEKAMQAARKDLQGAEKLWKDQRDMVWRFVPRRAFKLNMAQLSQKTAQAEERYQNAVKKWKDLQAPPDEIDVQVAQADLMKANAEVESAMRQRDAWGDGPDPDQVALAQARIDAAGQDLLAAQSAWEEAQIVAPFSGVVVSIPAKAGEWVGSGQPVLLLANLSSWQVQIDDLAEGDVQALEVGQELAVTFDALPDLKLRATVDSIGLLYEQKDGEPTYTVDITLLERDARLRWGMTARLVGNSLDV